MLVKQRSLIEIEHREREGEREKYRKGERERERVGKKDRRKLTKIIITCASVYVS